MWCPWPAEENGVAASGCEQAELASLSRVGRFLNSILDIEELLRAILEEALDAVGAVRGFVALIDRTTGELEVRFTAGAGWDEAHRRRRIRIAAEPGAGITSYVAATGVPYACGDVTRDPHYLSYFEDVRSEVAVPLLDRNGRAIGVLNIESERMNAFTRRDQKLLVALASQASIAITVAEYRRRERALIQLGQELATIPEMEQMLRRVVDVTSQILGADDCSVFEWNETRDRLILRASRGLLAQRVGEETYAPGEGLTGWVAQHGEAAHVEDVRRDPRWRGLFPELPPEQIESLLAAPIRTREGTLGVLRVVRRKRANVAVSHEFTPEDAALLATLADQVGATLLTRRLVEKLIDTERMAAWGEMSARSAHMIGNKVFALKGHLNEMEYVLEPPQPDPDAARRLVGEMREGVFRLEEILGEFREFVMATHLSLAEQPLNDLVRASVQEAYPDGATGRQGDGETGRQGDGASEGDIPVLPVSPSPRLPVSPSPCLPVAPGAQPSGAVRLRLDLAPELPPVRADAGKLRRAIGELVENAVTHQPEGGELVVTTGRWTAAEMGRLADRPAVARAMERLLQRGPAVAIEFRDRGPGIPEEDKQRVFQPFFTTRARGMGLGLSIVKGIVEAHGGAIAEIGQSGHGAHFLVLLPAADPTRNESTKDTKGHEGDEAV